MGYEGSWPGGAGSAGVGTSTFDNLSHAPWSTLCSAENDFNVGKIGSGIGMELYIERNYVGQFVGGNVGTQIAVGVDGYVNWS